TDTARFADLLLPAAAWGEKDGHMTNSERAVARLRAAVPAPGEALADWTIAARVAERLGHGRAFAWKDADAVFAEHLETTAGRDRARHGRRPAAPGSPPSAPPPPRRMRAPHASTPTAASRRRPAALASWSPAASTWSSSRMHRRRSRSPRCARAISGTQ